MSESDLAEEDKCQFRPLTRESIAATEARIAAEEEYLKEHPEKAKDDDEDGLDEPHPDPQLEAGMSLPLYLQHGFPPELIATPIEEIDKFYRNQRTFVVISKGKDVFRFSSTKAMWCMDPFNPVRRLAIYILVHPVFSMIVILTILINCVLMTQKESPTVEASEPIFTAIYTFESLIKILARGFILESFTYLRDAWNWLDFIVITLAYITMGIDLGNLSVLRTFRVLRALKTVAIVPGLKTIVGAVIESVKNLKDVIILTVFSLSVFALLGLQIYMGILTQKCIETIPDELLANWTELQRDEFRSNSSHWYIRDNEDEPLVCGNNSGATKCPDGFTCYQGYGRNPNHGYTSFDSFGWALLSSFRLMTQDFWENLYQLVLRAAGSWHMVFFVFIIFLGSFYLVNLILAIVAMSYDELQKKAELEEQEEAEALRLLEEEQHKKEHGGEEMSPSVTSSNDELFVGQQEKGTAEEGSKPPDMMSVRSEGGDSIPDHIRRPSQVRKSEEEKRDYVSQRLLGLDHGNIEYIDKDGSSIDSEDFLSKHKYNDNPFVDQMQMNPVLDMKDVMVLNDIIEQAAGPHSRASEQGDEEKEEGPKWKERCIANCLKFIDIFCVWNCCGCWVKFQELLCLFVYDAFVELFITLCIVVNTLFMAMDHHGMNTEMENALKGGNYFFTATFAIEASLKLLAISPKNYFKEGWNIFDFIIVALSLLELGLENVSGLSVLRSFRLLRVFKLAKSWPTLNLLISIMGKTVGALGNLTFVLGIIIFIFAVVGMQLFGKNYETCKSKFYDRQVPRWHFNDFMHSFMIVFRVLCGEWIESMWDCMLVAGWSCVPFFLATVVIGNLVVLNLFLALLLSSFGASNLSQAPTDNETNKLTEAIDRINRFTAWVKRSVRKVFMGAVKAIRAKVTNQIADQTTDARDVDMDEAPAEVLVDGQILMRDKKSPKEQKTALEVALNEVVEINLHGDVGKLKNKKKEEIIQNSQALCNSIKRIDDNKEREHLENHLSYRKSEDSVSLRSSSSQKEKKTMSSAGGSRRSSMASASEGGEEKRDLSKEDLGREDGDEPLEDQEVGEEGAMEHVDDEGEDHEDEAKKPVKCCPEFCYSRIPWCAGQGTPFWDGWFNARQKTLILIENKYFETLIIVCILISSLALAVEDRYIKEKKTLELILFYMDRVFTVVFFIEMLVKWLALGFRKYFTNAWCWLDFIIVLLSLLNLGAGMLGAGNIPAFKSMRTLRALRPLRALSRLQGMRVVVNALVQAIPSIMNVLLVCLIFWLIFSIMGVQMFGGKYYKCLDQTNDKLEIDEVPDKNACIAKNFSWVNSNINFDNVGNAYLALFQVATFKGWIDIMNDAIDSRHEKDLQPSYEININMYLFFVFFIIFGSFFTLNLFIGVIIDNFNEQKKKAGGSLEMFMTEDQKKYYNAMKKMGSKKPAKAIPRPRFRPQAIVFDITTDKKFDMTIMLFIGFNMIVMAMDQYQPDPLQNEILNNLNILFIAIFTTECSLKIFALRWYYFKEPWNMFDFVVVILSILGVMLKDLIEKYFVSPTLLRVVRVVKVGRVLRLVKGAKGIRTLLFALAMSLPALFNICLLLFLVMFIYAIFGMSFFKNVKYGGGLDETFNFGTFGQSMILLFQMSTSAGWDGVLTPLMNEENCTLPSDDGEDEGDCGSSGKAVVFLVSYLVIAFLIVINMYIAVILENYSQATEEVQEGLTDDDYDMYYEIWQKFDPNGTQYIKYEDLPDFLDELEVPLQIHKPNKYKIISMDIPICKGDLLYCVDILDALTKDFFARKGNPVEEAGDLGEVIKDDRPGYEVISSTLWRQREEFCARLIQKAWRRHRGKAHDRESSVVTQEAHDQTDSEPRQQQTSIVIESDGHVTKNGHKVVLHSRSPSVTSRSTDV